MSVDNAAVFSQPGAPAPSQHKQEHKIGFDVPVELIPLPSEGKVYPVTHALHRAEAVEIRCMTAREEDLMTSSALQRQGTIIPRLLKACLLDKSIDVDSLLSGDRDAILLGIRTVSYGANYKARVTCSECNHTYDETFVVNSLPIKHLGADPVIEGTNIFEYKLPLSQQRVRFQALELWRRCSNCSGGRKEEKGEDRK